MLKDESLEYIEEQFREKNEVLSEFGEWTNAWTMYEDIFDDLDQVLPVVIIDESEGEEIKHVVPMSISDAIEQAEKRNDVLLGGCSYFNNWISKRSAKDIYTFIIDMDNVYSGTLLMALRDNWKTASGEVLPMPTYIVNSGTGLHLYFVLTDPIPNYKSTTENLDKLYRALAVQQTTKRVYLHKQVQWFGQDFRMAGGLNKYNWKNEVFRVGDKWDIDELGRAVGLDDVHFTRYGEKRTKKPQKDGGRPSRKRKGWYSDRAWYDMALQNCQDRTKEGNRYMSMCALSVIAWKCKVPEAELERDLQGLLPYYNKGTARIVKPKEIRSAIKMYNEKAMLTQRETLENWQGWEYKPIKRNHQKQSDHLEEARTIRDIRQKRNGKKWYDNSPHSGRKMKKDIVKEWRRLHPDGKPKECITETGLNKTTVYKWWDE